MSSKNQKRKAQRYGPSNATDLSESHLDINSEPTNEDNLAIARQIISVLPSIKNSVKLTIQSLLSKADQPSLIVLQYIGQNSHPSSNSLIREIEQAIMYEELNTLDCVIATSSAHLPTPSKVMLAKLLTRSQAVSLRLGSKRDLDSLPFLAFVACSRISNMSMQVNVPFGLR